LDKAQDDNELNKCLVSAVKSSRRKGYHGQDCDSQMPELYETATQRAIKLLEHVAHVKVEKEEFFDVQSESSDADALKQRVKIHIKGIKLKDDFVDANDSKWKEIVMNNYDFVYQRISSNKDPKCSAAKFARFHDLDQVNYNTMQKEEVVQRDDNLLIDMRNKHESIEKEVVGQSTINFYDEQKFGFKQLFLKLAFEQIQGDLDLTHNFEMIYEFIKTFKEDLTNLKLRVISKTSLKSNHYWLLAIIPKLTSLKHFTLFQHVRDGNQNAPNDFFKFLAKAFSYFNKNQMSLDSFQMYGVNICHNDVLYSILKHIPDVKVLTFNNLVIDDSEYKAIGKVLSDYKNITELNLCGVRMTTQQSKEIADGLMRAKQLEVLRLCHNPNLECSSIIYNLAFSPRIRLIDVSENFMFSATSYEAIYKLIKISGSIETLSLRNTNFMSQLKKSDLNLAQAIGQSKSLKHLFFDTTSESYGSSFTGLEVFFKGIAMNKYKNGSLTHLSMVNGCKVDSAASVAGLFNSFKISDKDHEIWYGEKKVAEEMKLDQLEKKFHFGLQRFNLSGFNKFM
jgi:hypothetical protein